MTYQIHALPSEPFKHLFGLPDDALKAHDAKRIVADSKPGFPCRISLEEAEVGESLLLVNYEHHPHDSPYKSRHAVFVREGASQAHIQPDTVPDNWGHRLLSLRGFDISHDIIQAECCKGTDLPEMIKTVFENPDVDYIHIHNAKPGCFAARVTRTARA